MSFIPSEALGTTGSWERSTQSPKPMTIFVTMSLRWHTQPRLGSNFEKSSAPMRSCFEARVDLSVRYRQNLGLEPTRPLPTVEALIGYQPSCPL